MGLNFLMSSAEPTRLNFMMNRPNKESPKPFTHLLRKTSLTDHYTLSNQQKWHKKLLNQRLTLNFSGNLPITNVDYFFDWFMIDSQTGIHELRSNPQIMIKGKASPYTFKKRAAPTVERDEKTSSAPKKMSEEELRILKELKLRDSSVRNEEESHARMLGRHAGAIKYEYQVGPDGRAYVINGSVEVTPKFNSQNPEEIRQVLEKIRRAAITVSNPSQADLNVAASAASKVSMISQKEVVEKYTQLIAEQAEASSSSKEQIPNYLDTQA